MKTAEEVDTAPAQTHKTNTATDMKLALLITTTLALASCAGMKPNPDGSRVPVRYWPFIIE